MARIDKLTIDKIMDATNIVDVVGDFVSLKKRGANYWGLCPFHNDRSPSFSVSNAKGIFKCFSCGKAGSAVSFLMDLEGMSYVEAIKWLGKKYNIEVKEKELSGAERQAEAERDAMFGVNEYALTYFEDILQNTDDGRNIGLAYFRERGISDAMIKKFHLGYSLDESGGLYKSATKAGYNSKYLVDTGLCIKTDSGRIYDRFKGRVIYPVHALSGRVVAFGGRTLRKEKTVPKYVNSPESIIYSKSRELYGMYQARSAIARKKTCILVEGYMDVISMHQSGVENVVASSGTALTEGQVAMIKRFADKVILMYDSDFAGIKAALRGINMFVAAGISLKLVLLPEGDDPDSFAQSHTSTEVEAYMEAHEQDLIGFKTDILLKDSQGDPRKRSEAINDILGTIALIPNIIEQRIYIDECAAKVGLDPNVLAAQLKVIMAHKAENDYNAAQRAAALKTIDDAAAAQAPQTPAAEGPVAEKPVALASDVPLAVKLAEKELIQYVLRYGAMYLCDVAVGDDLVPITVIGYIDQELSIDDIQFATPAYSTLWNMSLELFHAEWATRHKAQKEKLEKQRAEEIEAGRDKIRRECTDIKSIQTAEQALMATTEEAMTARLDSYDAAFLREMLVRGDDRHITDAVVDMTSDPVVLSRMHPKVDQRKELCEKVPMAIYALKGALLKARIATLTASLDRATYEQSIEIMQQIKDLKLTSMEFDRCNGEMVITPSRHR